MMEDLPMVDDSYNTDAEMIDYETYDYEMQTDTLPMQQEPMQEYDMEAEQQVDYGTPIAAETEGMVAEEVLPAVMDVPIAEEPVVVAAVEVAPVVSIPPAAVPPPPPENIALPPSPAQPAPISVVVTSTPTVTPPSEPQGARSSTNVVEPVAAPNPSEIPIKQSDEPQHTEPPTSPKIVIPVELPSTSVVVETEPQPLEVPPPSSSEPNQETAPVPTTPYNEASALPQDVPRHSEPTSDVIVPPVALYFDEQPFALFSPIPGRDETECPVLLNGQWELFVSPLSQLLSGLRQQEAERLPDMPDCVLGLEHQALDLCIDETSKYADSYTLKDICDALIACNQPTIELTLYQITDFAQSLQQRLRGIVPEVIEDVDAGQEDRQEVVHILESEPVEGASEVVSLEQVEVQGEAAGEIAEEGGEGAAEYAEDGEPDEPAEAAEANTEGEFAYPQEESEVVIHATYVEEVSSIHPLDVEEEPLTVTVTEVEAEVPASDHPALILEQEDPEERNQPAESEQIDDEQPIDRPDDAHEIDGSSRAPNDSEHIPEPSVDDNSTSTGTLESSTHEGNAPELDASSHPEAVPSATGEHQEVEDEQDDEDAEGEPDELLNEGDELYADDDGSDELNGTQSQYRDAWDELETNYDLAESVHEAQGEIANQAKTADDSDVDGEPSREHEVSEQGEESIPPTKDSVQPTPGSEYEVLPEEEDSLTSSPSEGQDEYEEYDEEYTLEGEALPDTQETVVHKTADETELVVPEFDELDADVIEVPLVVAPAVGRPSAKRSLEERDEGGSDFDFDDFTELEAKRPRVE
ncbi:hypothetical protein FRB99_005083 [Tulasnella sp. 403]|nr:hypothetical protein FRB99_005083 [Tulasnella sp. 403]